MAMKHPRYHFRVASYGIRDGLSLDGYETVVPSEDWLPSSDPTLPLGKRLPFDWSPAHYGDVSEDYRGRFEPAPAYKNLVALANFAQVSKEHRTACLALADELEEEILENTISKGQARFVVRNYPINRKDHVMAAGWVNGLGNGFILRGLSRMQDLWPTKQRAKLMLELLRAFNIFNHNSLRRKRPWFSWIDKDGYLWFDEYPVDDGTASLVLNGHIHTLYGLYYARRHVAEPWVTTLLQGGLATMRARTKKFRVPNNMNRYDLRPGYKPDYGPERTIRQQRELARMTGDKWFDKSAKTFARDLEVVDLLRGRKPRGKVRLEAPPYDTKASAEKLLARAGIS